MGVSAKQERSKLRVAKIIEAAHQILLTKNTEDITISNLAIYSDLKRTSTYKFFANPDDVKELLVQRYIQECSENFLQTDNQDIYDEEVYRSGKKVFHQKYGYGKITNIDGDVAWVIFRDNQQKKVFLKYLQIIS